MSTAWACIYKKNTPGYPNPWEPCNDEINSILRCGNPQFNRPLTLNFAGYTFGTPDAYKNNNVLYASSSGVYEIRVTTGTSIVGCSGAFVQLTLSQGQNAGFPTQPSVNNQFLNTGFTVDASGYHSGLFLLPTLTKNTTISGYAAAISGEWTGVFNVLESLNVFPVPPVSVSFSAITNTVTLSITNSDPFLPAEGIIEVSLNTPNNPTSLGSWNLDPAVNPTSPTITPNLGSDFWYLAAYMLPSGFANGVIGPLTSGGHPATPTGMSLRWIYLHPNDFSPTPCIEVDVPSDKTDQFDPIYHVGVSYSPDNITWTALSSNVPLDPNNFPVGSGLGQYVFDISETASLGDVYFSTSGLFQDSIGNYFYGTIFNGGLFHLDSIKAFVKTATLGCGVNVHWEAPYDGAGYIVNVSGLHDGFQTQFTPGNNYAFTHNSSTDGSFQCGKVYAYTVCQADFTSLCSNQVSGSGVLILNPPDFTVYPLYIDPSLPSRPTANFALFLDWSQGIYDTNASFISGVRTEFLNSNEAFPVIFSYASTIESPNRGTVDNVTFNLSATQRSTITYTMQLITGEYPNIISGAFRSQVAIVPRQTTAPSLMSVNAVGSDVSVIFSGIAWQDPIEYYQLYRSGTIGPAAATIVIPGGAIQTPTDPVGGTITYTELGVPAGTWIYFLETIGFNAEYRNFMVVSNFSNQMSITI